MFRYLLEIGAVVYLVVIGSMVAGLLRSAKAGVQLAGQLLDQQHPTVGKPRCEICLVKEQKKK